MNLQLTGHHLDITPAIRHHVTSKLEKLDRHFDNITDVAVILTAEKLRHKVEITVHLPGKKDLFTECVDTDMYAAVDMVIDKVIRIVQKEKEIRVDRRREATSIKDMPQIAE